MPSAIQLPLGTVPEGVMLTAVPRVAAPVTGRKVRVPAVLFRVYSPGETWATKCRSSTGVVTEWVVVAQVISVPSQVE